MSPPSPPPFRRLLHPFLHFLHFLQGHLGYRRGGPRVDLDTRRPTGRAGNGGGPSAELVHECARIQRYRVRIAKRLGHQGRAALRRPPPVRQAALRDRRRGKGRPSTPCCGPSRIGLATDATPWQHHKVPAHDGAPSGSLWLQPCGSNQSPSPTPHLVTETDRSSSAPATPASSLAKLPAIWSPAMCKATQRHVSGWKGGFAARLVMLNLGPHSATRPGRKLEGEELQEAKARLLQQYSAAANERQPPVKSRD